MSDYDAAVAHFHSLSLQQQAEVIFRLAVSGWFVDDIADFTQLSVEAIGRALTELSVEARERVLAEQVAA